MNFNYIELFGWIGFLFIVCGCIGIPLSIIAFVVLANERPRIENIVLAIVFPLGTLGSFFFAWLTKKTNEVTEYLRHLANK